MGAPLLTESLAWDSALEVVEAAHGREHRERLLGAMRAAYLSPRGRAGSPLLRATDRFQWYRKGVLAMHAVREYVGAERVNAALRRFFERHGSATPPLPTTLDLYRELRAVTPDELRLSARGPVRGEHVLGAHGEAGRGGAGRVGRVACDARRAGAQGGGR